MSRMTIEEVMATDKIFLTPDEICGLLSCTAQLIRIRARDPKLRNTLGLPVMAVGNRVKIPTKGFIRFLNGDDTFAVESDTDKMAKKFYETIKSQCNTALDEENVLIKLGELIYDGGK
jgi:hypothetical protein